jgi:hypothetical protein
MSQSDLLEQKFRKLLVARYSPQNKCLVKDGEILYAPPAEKGLGARHGVSHEFVSAVDHKTRCKFGWIRSEDTEFTLREFLKKYSLDPSPEQAEVLFEMFSAIARLPDGTPVAGSYFSRGVEHRRVVLSFHKVLLYKPTTE